MILARAAYLRSAGASSRYASTRAGFRDRACIWMCSSSLAAIARAYYALGIALKEAGLADDQASSRIRRFRVPKESKIDPEVHESLTETQRARKAAFLERGLSDFYVGLCLDAHSQGVISLGRLSEALLCGHGELAELVGLYGRQIHGH
jgi:hypothetical protein